MKCDALIMDDKSSSDTKPTMKIDEQRSTVEHEASVSKIGEEQLFYAMSRGLSEADATAMIVNGFFDFFVKELPMEYAVELNRLIKLGDGRFGRLNAVRHPVVRRATRCRVRARLLLALASMVAVGSVGRRPPGPRRSVRGRSRPR